MIRFVILCNICCSSQGRAQKAKVPSPEEVLPGVAQEAEVAALGPRGASPAKRNLLKSQQSPEKSSAKTTTSESRPVDILDPVAMTNLYYIAHGAPDALDVRGFGWFRGSPKGKKKRKRQREKEKVEDYLLVDYDQ